MLRTSIVLLLTALVLSPNVSADDKNVDSDAFMKAQQLKMQARLSAETGDFQTAVKNILTASELTGDTRTTDRARRIPTTVQPGGGSPFANFGEILQLIQEQTVPPAKWFTVDGEGGALSISQQGVFLGSPAVMAAIALMGDDSALQNAAEFAKNANHNQDVRETSSLRLVSLPRLEAHVAELIAAGQAIPEDVRTIAGLSRIEYLFVFPETQDIVIGGPASDWTTAADGRNISVANQRPTLNLDDLVTLTRTFAAGGPGFFLCTIDPKRDQVASLQTFLTQNRKSLNAQTAAAFTVEMEQRLGLQNVYVQGIPRNSRIASVIVDADYRMKEIGIGKRQGPDGMKSYFDLLTRSEQRGSGSMDALRWWMAVGYDAINMSPNGKVFQFAGHSIQCLSENQIVEKDGQRSGTGKAKGANLKFAELFTKHLPALAQMDPVFADMENIFDLAMVSALVHSHGLSRQVNWAAKSFAADGAYRTQSVEVPTELMTAAQFRVFDGRNVVIQVAGGVRVDVAELVKDQSRIKESAELADQSGKATPLGQQNGRWWWDAATK